MSQEINIHRKLVCEPVTRPDGRTVTVYVFPEDECYQIVVSDGCFAYYPNEEAALLGDGNPLRGILRAGQAYYSAPKETLYFGLPKQLLPEIKRLKFSESNY